jgi:NADPH:quinone reductase-like Zn-dependent oxidoreductase
MRERRATGPTEGDCKALGAREVVAFDTRLAGEPLEVVGSSEEIRGVTGARGPAATRAMAVHEADPGAGGPVTGSATETAALDLLDLGHFRRRLTDGRWDGGRGPAATDRLHARRQKPNKFGLGRGRSVSSPRGAAPVPQWRGIMKYERVVITRHGGPEVLQVVEDALREPGPGEVRLRTLAAGVSFADIFMREGFHPESMMRRTPFTPGWDIVGRVDAIGSGVSSVCCGDRVAALPVVGGYSQVVYLPEEELVPVPSGVDDGEAVSLVLNYVTAYQMLHRTACVRPGHAVLVHSAAGGVGTALLELGRLAALEVYGTASSGKLAAVRDLGAVPIDYEHANFTEVCRDLKPDGLDAVFDGIGGTHLVRSLQTLRRGGRLVAYGLGSTASEGRQTRSAIVATSLAWLWAFSYNLVPGYKRVKLYSIQMLKRRQPRWFRDDLEQLLTLLSEGQIHPVIAERLPLLEARRAHEVLAAGSTTGKLVLTFD